MREKEREHASGERKFPFRARARENRATAARDRFFFLLREPGVVVVQGFGESVNK